MSNPSRTNKSVSTIDTEMSESDDLWSRQLFVVVAAIRGTQKSRSAGSELVSVVLGNDLGIAAAEVAQYRSDDEAGVGGARPGDPTTRHQQVSPLRRPWRRRDRHSETPAFRSAACTRSTARHARLLAPAFTRREARPRSAKTRDSPISRIAVSSTSLAVATTGPKHLLSLGGVSAQSHATRATRGPAFMRREVSSPRS